MRVEKVYTLSEYDDFYGTIEDASGYLSLSGPFFAVIDSYRQYGLTALIKGGATIGLVYPDAFDEIQCGEKLFV